ncbi:flagellar motor switch protein FliM [Aeromonas taiwanensis]|uniref:Flagellar motor switch protein FliM n=2 Tax=Aeromonas taiwanensis TaxID=633417 RepID=A0A5F0KFM5_9GAMM|nr:flagellar motor switch protein FliM [Aeromonas taiwanensis]TFF81165.1 flagellar motor switch protein FliM [Aeromonas taiwanensis]TFF83125.1 flagellar motor switch protein FliM [Aeromonas taiwanensis]
MAQLFNAADCDLGYQDFASAFPQEQDDHLIWVEARTPLDAQRITYFAIDPAVIYRLAVLFFGGSLQHEGTVAAHGRGLTDTEQRLLLRLCQYQVEIWSACQGQGDLAWQLALTTRDALPASRLWVAQAGMLAGGRQHDWQFWLAPPEETLSIGGQSVQPAQLEQALTQVPVRLRVVMGQMSMTLADLECLKVGDVLSLDLPEVVPALIGHRPCFNGRIAEHKGSLVYQVAAVVEE